MSLPASLHGRFSVPVIAAPMFLVSGPELVIETCKAGVAGTFPALNARPAAQLDEWLTRIDTELAAFRAANPAAPCAPHGVNLILHASNARLKEDLATLVRHRVPIVITSLGNPAEVADVVHGYGGLVLSDVVHAYHARKAIAAGVDGIIAVAGGAGGHAGVQSTISLVREIREFWDGLLVVAGSISDGAAIRAVEVLGADLAYMGTRFIATRDRMGASTSSSDLPCICAVRPKPWFIRSVSTKPGQMALTQMPWPPISSATQRVRPTTACLETL